MDTEREIAMDRYFQDHFGECGTCKHECKYNGVYYCEITGERVDEIEECDEWTEYKAKL